MASITHEEIKKILGLDDEKDHPLIQDLNKMSIQDIIEQMTKNGSAAYLYTDDASTPSSPGVTVTTVTVDPSNPPGWGGAGGSGAVYAGGGGGGSYTVSAGPVGSIATKQVNGKTLINVGGQWVEAPPGYFGGQIPSWKPMQSPMPMKSKPVSSSTAPGPFNTNPSPSTFPDAYKGFFNKPVTMKCKVCGCEKTVSTDEFRLEYVCEDCRIDQPPLLKVMSSFLRTSGYTLDEVERTYNKPKYNRNSKNGKKR